MVIFLPLLFADGQPTSLERITQHQLEKFIPFMVSCCPESTSDATPKWWHPSVPYKIPLINPKSDEKWLSRLKEIVCRCYEYHKCEHVLRFCSRLAQLPPSALKYRESSQGCISIFNKTNNKLIVTFKKRNQIYDRQNVSPFKTLLPRKPSQPPREQHIEDIYLCNYCDEEFTSGKDIVAHEAICKGKVDEESSKNATLDQELFVRYFGLCPSNKSPKKQGTPSSKRGTSVRLTPRTYCQIPISSPLGLRMGVNVCKLKSEDQMDYLSKVEAQCRGKVWNSSQTRHPRRYGGSGYRSFRRKKMDVWTHTYCFNRAQQHEKKLTLKTGLNKRARLLLRKCKKAVVLVERLPLMDPLALHAAASLHYHADALKNHKRDQDERQERGICVPSPEKPSTDMMPVNVFIDLTCDEGINHDELSLKENFCNNRGSKDMFFNSSSNHKRPPLKDWSAIHPVSQFILA